MTNVAKAALADGFAAPIGDLAIAVITAVASVTAGGGRQERVAALATGSGLVVAGRARHAELAHVLLVVEAQRQALRRKDDGTRAAVARARSGRPILLGDSSGARHSLCRVLLRWRRRKRRSAGHRLGVGARHERQERRDEAGHEHGQLTAVLLWLESARGAH